MKNIVAYLKRNPSAGLLFVQLLGLVLYPLMDASPRGRVAFGVFGLLVLALALRVVRRSPWLTWLGILLAAPVVALSAVMIVSPNPTLFVVAAGFEAAFYFYATGSLIAYTLHDWVATADEYFAAGATFTLLAWGFAYLFVVCQAIVPGSFIGPGDEAVRSWTELLYLSIAVLSSVGLSDILPATPMARALVMLESIAGIMFIALVVSRLISLNVHSQRSKP